MDKNKISAIVNRGLRVLSVREEKVLLEWAEQCQKINHSRRPAVNKFTEITKITLKGDTLKSILSVFWRNAQKELWEDRSIRAKVTILAIVFKVAIGGEAIVIIPLFLLTAAGGTFLALLIDELKRRECARGDIEKTYKGKEANLPFNKRNSLKPKVTVGCVVVDGKECWVCSHSDCGENNPIKKDACSGCGQFLWFGFAFWVWRDFVHFERAVAFIGIAHEIS